MNRKLIRICVASASLILAFASLAAGAIAAEPPASTDPDALIHAIESGTLSHAERLHQIAELRAQETSLSSAQRWHLRFLDAKEDILNGNYDQAEPVLRRILEQSNDAALAAQASAQLMSAFSIHNQYDKAYTLLNKLTEELPTIKSTAARVTILVQASQLLAWAGQFDLSLQYARMLEKEPGVGSKCVAYSLETGALLNAGQITSVDPLFKTAIASCLATGRDVNANAIRLELAYLLIDEGHAPSAIALLRTMEDSVREVHYQPHSIQLQTTLAKAYLETGNNAKAMQLALDAIAGTKSDPSNMQLRAAYEVLYLAEKRAGNAAAALKYHELYVALDESAATATEARALAYQMVKQDVLAKKVRVDTLSKQNKILQLRQALAHKSAETSHLYLVLLLVVLTSIVLILWRVKHTQLRFRRMARHDGLTDTLNRQYFLDQAQKTLHRLEKSHTDACLVLMDLDHFKRVNDTFGHVAGDEVLARIVASARGQLRASDVFGRLGGEEFGILMPGCGRDQGVEITHRIRNAIADTPVALSSGPVVHMSASFGLACASVTGYVMRDLLTVADAALYRAKDGGRNRLEVGVNADRHAKAVGTPVAPAAS